MTYATSSPPLLIRKFQKSPRLQTLVKSYYDSSKNSTEILTQLSDTNHGQTKFGPFWAKSGRGTTQSPSRWRDDTTGIGRPNTIDPLQRPIEYINYYKVLSRRFSFISSLAKSEHSYFNHCRYWFFFFFFFSVFQYDCLTQVIGGEGCQAWISWGFRISALIWVLERRIQLLRNIHFG